MLGKKRLSQSLTKTRRSLIGRIGGLLRGARIDEAFWEELEASLIESDLGVATTMELVNDLRDKASRGHIKEPQAVQVLLWESLKAALDGEVPGANYPKGNVWVMLVVGVNGSGKTTSIAKLARYHQNMGRSVLLAAADTFRAAAIDQLRIWGERLKVEVVSHQPGGDPGAVVFDAIQAAVARNVDTLIIDTAGRLHTKYNLMEELKKVHRVARRLIAEAPQEVVLVLDASTGQNALSQAKYFKEAVEVTGIFLAKLDGTAKGGMAFAIKSQLAIPIQYVGLGEGLDDLALFDPNEFVDGLFREE